MKAPGKSVVTPQNATEVISRLMLADVFPIIVDLEKSQGNRIYDSVSGRYLLDCFSYIASNPLGHNHPKLFDAEFERKLMRAARTKPSNSDLYSVEMAEFVEAFGRLALPATHRHLFFVEGGTLAVENGLKVAFDWKVRKNFARGEKSERGHDVIHFREAFHGRSGYSISLTNTADPRKTKFFPKFDWPRIANPKCVFPLEGDNLKRVIAAEEEALSQIRTVLDEREADVAAIILESIQAEGGDNHFRPEFHQALRCLADEYPVMLIYDEIQAGVGLTGKMWAYEHFGISPDVVVFGKKMQVCGLFANKRVEEVENHVFQERSRINSTWGGSLVDMVRAQRFLEIIDEEDLVQNAARVGDVLLRGLYDLQNRYPDHIENARGLGLMCAFDLRAPEKREAVLKKAFDEGAIIIPCGKASIRLRPSLTFTQNDVAELLDILERAVG